MKINYMDLFSGIGGFSLALKQTNVEIETHYYSEIDDKCKSIYKNHFKEAKGLGDVKTIKNVSKLEKIDFISFGFPCQDLSVAGKRKGFDGEKSVMFFEAIRIIKECKPTCFILENVKGFLSNNKGEDFIKALQEIANIGIYDCEWQLVNTKWFLPQNRERVFLVGYPRGKCRAKIFPLTEADGIYYETSEENNHSLNKIGVLKNDSQANRIYSSKGIATCLQSSSGGLGAKTGLYAIYQKARGKNQGGINITCPTITSNCFQHNNIVIPVLTPNRKEKRQNGRRYKNNGEPSFTLTAQDQHGIFNGKDVRRLTPIECERLQGFPDDWTKTTYDQKTLSDNQRYKLLGNAVTVNVVKQIMEKIIKILEEENNEQ